MKLCHNTICLIWWFITSKSHIEHRPFYSKQKCHYFTKYFSCFMSTMHELQIFREKLQFSRIAFRLENPTQALPSRHWFHHNLQCFFFFQLSCHSSPQVMQLNMLDICLWVLMVPRWFASPFFSSFSQMMSRERRKTEENVA